MRVDEFLRREVSRRQFLDSSARNAAGVAAGIVGLSGAVAQQAAAQMPASERVSLAVIGVRGYGRTLATEMAALPDADVRTLCDVDAGLLRPAAEAVSDVQASPPRLESDFRRVLDDPQIDAVVIATPDHWHALMTVLACQAGKDVYVEAPVSHNLREGERMIAAARRHERLIQCGLQQRSGAHFQSAVALSRS
ncbi:MAG: Gfo/Idh/MocA family protein, partial [Planctomycetaceae bacterium]